MSEAYKKIVLKCETCGEFTSHVVEENLRVCIECNLTEEAEDETIEEEGI
jgi:hypothetical protein